MDRLLFSFTALFLGIGILLVGNGLLGTLLGLRATDLGFSTEVTGIVMAAYFAGFMLGSLRSARYIAAAGHIRTFAAMASVVSAVTLAHMLLDSALAWAVLRALMGFCFAGIYMVAESWLNDRSTNSNRGQVLSIYMTLNLVALGLGQLFLLMPAPGGFELFTIAAILMSLSLVPVALTRTTAPAPTPVKPMLLGQLYRASPLALVGCFASGVALGAFWGMFPVYARISGISDQVTALLVLTTVVGGVLSLWPAGRIADRMDRRWIIALVCAANAAVALILLTVGGRPGPAMFVLVGILGSVTFPIYSLAVAHANDYLDRDDLIAACSGLLLVYGAGAIAGPLASGLVMRWAGPPGYFITLAASMATTALFALYRMRVRHGAAPVDREALVLVPRTTPAAFSLDPRVPADPAEEADET